MREVRASISKLLAAHGLAPKKRFGQHFMLDRGINRQLIAAAGIVPGDTVLEIGSGTGSLTGEILAAGASVVAVEIDRGLAALLSDAIRSDRLRILSIDALDGKHRLAQPLVDALSTEAQRSGKAEFKWVSNLPFNVATPLMVNVLSLAFPRLVKAAVTVQWEVAERLTAAPGKSAYGPATVQVRLRADVEIIRRIRPGSFWPRPKVDSAAVVLTPLPPSNIPPPAVLSRFLNAIFAHRRKTLKACLARVCGDSFDPNLLKMLDLKEDIRPECLEPRMLLKLYLELERSGATKYASETS